MKIIGSKTTINKQTLYKINGSPISANSYREAMELYLSKYHAGSVMIVPKA